MYVTKIGTRLARWGVALATFATCSAAYAQGCAMCYTSASSAKAAAIQALRSGILILLVPVLVFSAAIIVVVFLRRNQFHEWGERLPSQDDEMREMLARLGPINPENAAASYADRPDGVS